MPLTEFHEPRVTHALGRRWIPRRVARGPGWLALCVIAPLLAACSREPEKIPLFPVTGSVKFGDEIPVGAQIVLHPLSQTLPDNLAPNGVVGEDGRFTIGTYDKTDGAPAGQYKVTVFWFTLVTGVGGSGAGPNVIPKVYGDPAKTPVSVSVDDAPTDLPPIVIPK